MCDDCWMGSGDAVRVCRLKALIIDKIIQEEVEWDYLFHKYFPKFKIDGGVAFLKCIEAFRMHF